MAMDIENQQIGNVSVAINPQIDLSQGSMTANATSKLGNLISNFGQQIETTIGSEWGKETALADINKNLDKGANGNFSHVSNFTPYGRAYNQVMDKVVPSVLTSQGGMQLQEYYLQLKNSNLPSTDLVEEFSKGSKEIIDKYISNVSPEFRSEVKVLLTQQAGQNQQQLINHVGEVQSQQQSVIAYNSLNDLYNLASNASQSKNLTLANNYANQIFSTISAGVDTGRLSAIQAKSLEQMYTNKLLSDVAISNGIESAKDFNDQLPEGNRLDQKSIENLQQTIDNHYLEQQKDIQINQTKRHLDIDENYSQALDGLITVPTTTLTDTQFIRFNEMVKGGQLVKQLNKVNPVDQVKIYDSNEFKELPLNVQSLVKSKVAQNSYDIKTNPYYKLDLDKKSVPERVATLANYGIDYSNIVSPERLATIRQAYSVKPYETVKGIDTEFGQYAPLVIKAMSKGNQAYGANIDDKNLRDQYLFGSSLPHKGQPLNLNKLSDDEKNGLLKLPVDTQVTVFDLNDKIGNYVNMSRNEIYSNMWSFKDGNFMMHKDYEAFKQNYNEIRSIIQKAGAKDFNWYYGDLYIQFDPNNSVYNFYHKSNNQLLYSIPRRSLPLPKD